MKSNVNSTPLILSGREVATEVLNNVISKIKELDAKNKRIPGLAVLLIGEDPASTTYVKNKEKACKELGIYSELHKLSNNISEEEVINKIELLNNNPKIDGILIQLPLPNHINPEKVIEKINPNKDVDGLHPYNLGKLLRGQACLKPCTPLGVIKILKYYSINIQGTHVVIVGRSNLVGKPLSMLLLQENATVTVIHSKTINIENITKTADILISAIGKPNLITKNWVKENTTVIDVGINQINQNGKKIFVGDVDFHSVSSICKAITPVPGGVGPMTIAMLMANTVEAYKLRA